MKKNTFDKSQHICSMKRINTLFEHSSSFINYPLKVVYRKEEKQTDLPCVQLLLSVSKHHFKRAIKRNRIKRQLREAFRKNSHALKQFAIEHSIHIDIALLWVSNELFTSGLVEEKVVKALEAIAKQINEKEPMKRDSDT